MANKKVYIATARPIGEKCKEWALDNMPDDWEWGGIDNCDVFISVMYEKLLDENFINSKRSCFNFHPGVLPEYRGSGAYSWAIINEEDFAGVTLHEVDVSIDHGNIIYIAKFPISSSDTAGTLFSKAEDTIFEMFKMWFHRLLLGKFTSYPQNESNARTYYRKDLEKAKDLTKYVRAFTFPGKEKCYFVNQNKKVYIC